MELTVPNFFKTVLPSQGIYAIAYKDVGTGFVRHEAFSSLEGFLTVAQNQDFLPRDYWFACSSFARISEDVQTKDGVRHRFSRSKDNSQYQRSLWLDIDVGEDKPYKSTYEALDALKNFCLTIGMLIPTIVYSGSGGLHVYWSFTQDLHKTEWQALAEKLHEATVQLGLHTDPMRTRDTASILRIPATFNWKHALPTPVTVQYIAPQQSVAYYAEKLAKYTPAPTPQKAFGADINVDLVNAVRGVDFSALLGGVDTSKVELPETTFATRKAEDVVAQCLQLQQQNNAPEPVWRGMLATLRHCEGGVEMAHKLSAQDPRYNAEDTDDKLDQLATKNIAPYTCRTFQDLRPEVCNQCPHRGVINSPISVPQSKITTVQVDETGSIEVAPIVAGATLSTIPAIETKQYRVNETGCFVLVEHKTTGKTWWDKFYDYPVYPIQRIRDKNTLGEIEVSYVFRKHHRSGYDDFQVMGETLMGQGIGGFLGSVGFLLTNEERKHMVGLMIDLLKEVGPELEETTVMNNLGWSKDMKSFLLGNKLYKTDGTVIDIAPKGLASTYSNETEGVGDLETAKQIFNIYNRRGAEWGQVAIASAFASPLMKIGSLEHAALLFLTGDAGVGKSTALLAAVSVFANPTTMVINKDDTLNSRIAKLGIMSNIAVGFDEMTDMPPHEASTLAYQITQGRGKDRMTSSGEGLQINKAHWSCLPIMTANDSIINALANHSFNASAQMSRVLEIKATDTSHLYSEEEFENAKILTRKLPYNYGLAGDIFMRWVTANMDTVHKMIYDMEKIFIKRSGLGNDYRFYYYMCTRMLVGITIAKKLGLVDYDIEVLLDYMVDMVNKNKNRIVKQVTDESTILGSFLSEHISSRIVVKSDVRPQNMPFKPELGESNDAGYVLQRLGNGKDLTIRVARDENIVYISHKAIKDWCIKTSTPQDKFMTSVSTNAEIIFEKKRDYLGKLTQYHDTGRVNCLVIRLYEDLP